MTGTSIGPSVEWRVLWWTQALNPAGAPGHSADLFEALRTIPSVGLAVHVVVSEASGWSVYAFKSARLVTRPSLDDLVVLGLESQAVVVDARGQVGIAAPGARVPPLSLGFARSDLGLDSATPSLNEAVNRENLLRATVGTQLLPVVKTE